MATIILRLGGMGELYRARDTKLDRAIKILPAKVASDRERMRRFVHEAKAAAISHVPTFMKLENPAAPASLP
jgi:eukaryotic-like serine/threonine-protein kinase